MTERFDCHYCKESLFGKKYILKEDSPCCVKCYENLYSNTCEECKKPIGADCKDLSYKDRHWHETCFHCFQCKNSLVDKPFAAKEEHLLCTDCYSNEYSSKCNECKKTIMPDVSRGNKLKLMLQKREASAAAVKPEVSVKETAAKEFLSSLRRQRRQLWDRSQPDVQQWYQQFLYLGFDEQKFEDDISYWTNLGRARNEYYGGYYQHHYDEDAPIGPRDPHAFRHGAGVNYDDY